MSETADAPTEVAPADTVDFAVQGPTRPLLGAALSIFGALTWAYVVLGELVVNLDLTEQLALLLVVAILAATWYRVARHHARQGKPGRAVASGLLGIMLSAAVLFLSAVVWGSSRHKDYEAVTFLLCLLSIFAFFLGRRLTNATRLELSKPQRAGLIVVWTVSGLGTLLALASAFSRM